MGVGPPHRRNPPPLYLVERGPGGEARSPAPEAVVFPHPPLICPPDGDWQMQDHPGAPGTARQGRTRTIVSTNDGGKATQPRAPGHERPRAAPRAARHGRLSAALRAPGADVPLAMTAGAPGQHCLSAAPRAPGHERPLAAQRAAGRDRLSAALRAPGADVPLATTARAPGQHRLRAAPIATVPSPAGLRRLRQGVLPRVPANPRTLTYPHSHRINRRSHASGNPRPPVATGGGTGGLRTGNPRCVCPHFPVPITLLNPSSASCHPGTAHPRSCSAACTGLLHQHPSRAPPTPTHRLVVAACAAIHVPPQRGGTIGEPLCALCMLCG